MCVIHHENRRRIIEKSRQIIFLKKNEKIKKSWSGLSNSTTISYPPQDQAICLFAGLLGGPDRAHGQDECHRPQ
jgi:hypothetical protein